MNSAEAELDKQRCQQAYELRHQGHTYKQVGLALNISEDYARQMVQVNDIIQQRQAMWTDGLSPALPAPSATPVSPAARK